MKFLMIVKGDKNSEAGIMSDPQIFAEMGKYNDELVKAGVLLGGEGLHPTSKATRIVNSGGKLTLTDGPFAEAKEIVAGFWIIQVKSKEEAIEWAKRIPYSEGAKPVELREIGGPIQGNPAQPAVAPKKRYMVMFKATPDSEAGRPPAPEVAARMNQGMGEMMQAGVLIAAAGLTPSSRGARVHFVNGTRSVVDGPFAETKELVAGFAILLVDSKEEAIKWASRGATLCGDCECEVRPLFEESDFPAEIVAAIPEVFAAEREFRERSK